MATGWRWATLVAGAAAVGAAGVAVGGTGCASHPATSARARSTAARRRVPSTVIGSSGGWRDCDAHGTWRVIPGGEPPGSRTPAYGPAGSMRRPGPAGYAPAMDQDVREPGPTARGGPPETDQPEEQDWAAYYRYSLGREPRPLFLRGWAAIEEAGAGPGTAVDVGFGDGTETMHLLDAGWRVTAIDSAPAAVEVLEPRVPRRRPRPADHRDRARRRGGPAPVRPPVLGLRPLVPPARRVRAAVGAGPRADSARAGSSSSTSSVTATRGPGSRTRRSSPRGRRGGAARRAGGHRARPRSRRTAARFIGPTHWHVLRRRRAAARHEPTATRPASAKRGARALARARGGRGVRARRAHRYRARGGGRGARAAGGRALAPATDDELADARDRPARGPRRPGAHDPRRTSSTRPA